MMDLSHEGRRMPVILVKVKIFLQFEYCCDISATKFVFWILCSFPGCGYFSSQERVFLLVNADLESFIT